MSDQKTMGLFAKMATIMGELERLAKDGKSDQLRYKFVRDADVFDTVREQLAQHNIAFFPAVLSYEQTPITSKNGAAGYHTVISLEFTFVCGDTGETRSSLWAGESDSYDDKGISKAITLAQKTFLLKTFVLSTGDPNDDPDSRSEEASHRGSRPQPQKPAPAASQPVESAPSALDEHFGPKPAWYTDVERVRALLTWAHGLWKAEPGMTKPHAMNRVAKVLGITPAKGSDFEAFVAAMNQYGGSAEAAQHAIEAYAPKTEEQPELPQLRKRPVKNAGKTAAERHGIAAGQ